MLGSYLKYGLRDTLRSLMRHKGMVMITVLTVTITFMILGSAVLISLNGQHIEETLEDDVEIIVFMQSDISREDALAVLPQIKSVEGFESYEFVTKEEALEIMNAKFGEDSNLIEALGGNNPLPDAYYVKVSALEYISSAASVLEEIPGVELVRYGQDTVENMSKVSKALWGVCLIVVVAMIIAALFLVNSTIRLTVSARSEEIAIMRYVGATNFYIRIPFFMEGLVLGLIGAVFASLLLVGGYQAVIAYAAEKISFLHLIDDGALLIKMTVGFLIGGALLGAVGSNIAVKKYLKV